MEKIDNVTTRRRHPTRARSLENESGSLNSSSVSDLMGKSLDISTFALTSNMEKLNTEVISLRTNLLCTQNELENIIIENNGLKKQISQLAQEVEILKQICRSPVSSHRKKISSTSKKSAKRRLTDSFRISPCTLTDSDQTTKSGRVKELFLEGDTHMVQSSGSNLELELPKSQENVESITGYENDALQVCEVGINFTLPNVFSEDNKNQQPGFSTPDDLSAAGIMKPVLLQPMRNACNKVDSKPSTCHQRVLILADENGRDMGVRLQKLLGDKFQVFSFIKSYASTKQVLDICNSNYCKDFTKQDFVIVLTGSNDFNPLELQSSLYCCMSMLINTNVLLGTVFKSWHLNKHRVNNVLRLVSSNFNNCRMLELDTYYGVTYRGNMYKHDKETVCGFILKDILQICYRNEYLNNFVVKTHYVNEKIICKNVSTQTMVQVRVVDQGICEEAGSVSSEANCDATHRTETFFR